MAYPHSHPAYTGELGLTHDTIFSNLATRNLKNYPSGDLGEQRGWGWGVEHGGALRVWSLRFSRMNGMHAD